MTTPAGSSFIAPPVSTGGPEVYASAPAAPPLPLDPALVDLKAREEAAAEADAALLKTLPPMREYFSLTRTEREPVDRGVIDIRAYLAESDAIGMCVMVEKMLEALAFNKLIMLEHLKGLENEDLMAFIGPLVRLLGEAKRRRRS